MSIPLPYPNVLDAAGLLEASGVQRNFEAINGQFPVNTAVPPEVSAFPTTGLADGQPFVYSLGASNGAWEFRYDLDNTHWVFTGGPPLTARIATNENTNSTGPVELATKGPGISLPLAGSYIFEYGAGVYTSATTGGNTASTFLLNPGLSVIDKVQTNFSAATSLLVNPMTRLAPVSIASANQAWVLQYGNDGSGATANFQQRWISATPIWCV